MAPPDIGHEQTGGDFPFRKLYFYVCRDCCQSMENFIILQEDIVSSFDEVCKSCGIVQAYIFLMILKGSVHYWVLRKACL